MQAVLLAGGKGTRLRPYTHVLPKPLMPLGLDDPMPIIEVVLRQLARSGFRDVTIITGYLTELIEAFCGDGRKFGTRLQYRREVTPLGTAGGLTLLDRPSEPVLVINGDILTTLDFAEMYAFHRAPRAAGDHRLLSPRGQDRLRRAALRRRSARLDGLSTRSRSTRSRSAWASTSSTRSPGTTSTPGRSLPMPDLLETMRRGGHDVHCFRAGMLLAGHRPARRLRAGQRGLRIATGRVPGRSSKPRNLKIGRDQ